MTHDIAWMSYFLAAVVIYYGALFVMAHFRRPPPTLSTLRPVFVLLVPARNEELVIGRTLESLTSLDYPDYLVLLLNDGSTDNTSRIAHQIAHRDDRVVAIDRDPGIAGQGKSAVLNHGFRHVARMIAENDPRLGGRSAEAVILGIVDADGCLERHALRAVAPYFDDRRIGSVQIGVRIANARNGLLERLQDLEFVGFSCLVQIARDHLGSVGMGGNGQFTRMEAAETIGQHPWKREALTEDLDLGLSLIEAGWATRFCADAFVLQQGLATWRPLLRQRVRWTQGHYQCWTHIPRLAKNRDVPLRSRLDLIAYLMLVTTMVIVAVNVGLGILGSLGVVEVTNSFLSFLPNDSFVIRLTTLGLSLLPLFAFVTTYQRHSNHPFSWWELPAAAFAFTLYSYVWIFSTIFAWYRMATGQWSWTKTPRVQTSETPSGSEHVAEQAGKNLLLR